MKQLKLVLFALLFVWFCNSCQKSEVETTLTDEAISEEAISEILLIDIDALTEESMDWQLSLLKSGDLFGNYFVSNCPAVTYDKESTPRKMTLDFGTTGCKGKDGKTRSGKIVITSSSFENKKMERTKTFVNFEVEGLKITGNIKKTVTFDMAGHSQLSIVEEDLTLTNSENKKTNRKGILTREHSMRSFLDRTDDKITTWGEITGTRDGVAYSKTISDKTPLVFLARCKQIVSGMITRTSGTDKMVIDFGKGECDNEAIVTKNGETKTIKLRR